MNRIIMLLKLVWKRTTLNHKIFNDTVENATLVSKAFLHMGNKNCTCYYTVLHYCHYCNATIPPIISICATWHCYLKHHFKSFFWIMLTWAVVLKLEFQLKHKPCRHFDDTVSWVKHCVHTQAHIIIIMQILAHHHYRPKGVSS